MTPTRETFGNISPASQLVFYVVAASSMGMFCFGVWRRWKRWRIGAGAPIGGFRTMVAQLAERVRHTGTRALVEGGLQQRVLGHGIGSIAHVCLFLGFMVLFAGTVLLEIDHLASAASPGLKFHQGLYYVVYKAVLDVFGLFFLLGTTVFIACRLFRRPGLGHRSTDWFVLVWFLVIGISGYFVEALRLCWQQPSGIAAHCSPVGLALGLLFHDLGELPARQWHVVAWWFHSLCVFVFIAAIPFTRLLHFVVGPLNLLLSSAMLGTLQVVTIEEVERTGRVGPTDIRHFTWQQLLSLDACVSCGRCDEVCPALQTAKPLSPQGIVQGLKAAMDHAATNPAACGSDALAAAVSADALWSCTTCSACVNTCPVRIDHLAFIIPLRRQLVAESMLRGTAAVALRRIQSHANPWGFPAVERGRWSRTES